MPELIIEISKPTTVSDVSIIRESLRPAAALNNCREALKFFYNAVSEKDHIDEAYLQNIYFGSLYPSYDGNSSFAIHFSDYHLSFNKNDSLKELNILKKDDRSDKIFTIKKNCKNRYS